MKYETIDEDEWDFRVINPNRDESRQLPSELIEEFNLHDGDMLLLKANPSGSNYAIRWWKHLTSGKELLITTGITDLIEKYDTDTVRFRIKGIIPGREKD